MALRGVNSSVVVLLLALSLSGCLLQPSHTVQRVPPGSWMEPLGGSARAAYAGELAPEAPREQWRRGMERGLQSPPIVHGDLLIIGSTGRALLAASAADGDRYWRRRFNGPIVGSPLRVGERVYVATASRDGGVYAYSVARGRKVWHTKLRSPAAGEPVIAGDRLIISSVRGELTALDLDDGDVIWRVRVPGGVVGAPLLVDGDVVIATARDTLLRLGRETGALRAARALPASASAGLARAGERVLVPLHPGSIASFDVGSLAPVRVDSIGALVLSTPVVDAEGAAWVLTRTGEVWNVGTSGARRIASLGGTARESLTLARNGLLVGRLDGTLFLLRTDGTEVWRQSFRSSLRAPVALSAGAAYVSLLNGDMVKLQ